MVRASVTFEEHHDEYLKQLQEEREDVDSRSDAVRTCIAEHRDGAIPNEELDTLTEELHELELETVRLETANEHLVARLEELRAKNADIEAVTDDVEQFMAMLRRHDSIPVEAREQPSLPEGEDEAESEDETTPERSGPLASIRSWFS